jgi:flagellar biosynthesis protein FlhA
MTTVAAQASGGLDLRSLLRSKDAALAIGLVVIISLMIIPLPSAVVDILLVLNLTVSIGIMLITLYVKKVLDFSVFPSVLLILTLFRLGLTITTSRLILTSGNAGTVVTTFGTIVVGGNYLVGIIIFIMLVVIQLWVITAGAVRTAEVAARFTLDAMPGKQLSIDADLNAGMIDEAEARARRKEIEQEADLFGSMDGALRIVHRDSQAALMVMMVNVLGGFLVGVLMRGMSLLGALQSYTLQTAGAGLAVQIPALLVSSACGILVTRNTSEGTLGGDLFSQLGNSNALGIGGMIVFGLGLVPGLPWLPFFAVGGAMVFLAYTLHRRQTADAVAAALPAAKPAEATDSPEAMLDQMMVDPLELEVGYGLIPLVDEERSDNLLHRVTAIRKQILSELGLVMPIVRIRDNLRLPPPAYRVKIRGEEVARGELLLDRYLAIPGSEADEHMTGVKTTEPAFGLPAIWISEAEKGRAELQGYTVVNPLSVLSTHLTEVVRRNAGDLLGRQMVQDMLNRLKAKSPASVEGVVPEMLTLGEVQAVLRNLLRERVSIRDLPGILEVLAKHAGATRDPNILAEAVRQTLARALSNQFRDDTGFIHVFTLSPSVENVLKQALGPADGGLGFSLDPQQAQAILTATGEQMEKLAQDGHQPVLLCPRELRMAFRRLVEQPLPNLTVLAYSEISGGTRVRAHGMVDLAWAGVEPAEVAA